MREASGSLPWGMVVESLSILDPLYVGGTGENSPLHGLGSFQDLEVCRVWEAVGRFFRRYSSLKRAGKLGLVPWRSLLSLG